MNVVIDLTLPLERALTNSRVLVTGHTGFTGGWACVWLHNIGAEVHGLSLDPITEPNLFSEGRIAEVCKSSHIRDLRDAAAVKAVVDTIEPDLILHLAAQPLVRASYVDPAYTYEVNVNGTLHILQAAQHCESVKGVLCITTDKVYRNFEWCWPYRETDELGGSDPYSASKSCAELLVSSWRYSMASWGRSFHLATARGGNIVGGGDWSDNRLIPDFVRSAVAGETLALRYPQAVRPWQHVLCLVHGYLEVLGAMMRDEEEKANVAWNFGPTSAECLPVGEVVSRLERYWPGVSVDYRPVREKEAGFLYLDSSKARQLLSWAPVWEIDKALERTAQWYHGFHVLSTDARELLEADLLAYRSMLAAELTETMSAGAAV